MVLILRTPLQILQSLRTKYHIFQSGLIRIISYFSIVSLRLYMLILIIYNFAARKSSLKKSQQVADPLCRVGAKIVRISERDLELIPI